MRSSAEIAQTPKSALQIFKYLMTTLVVFSSLTTRVWGAPSYGEEIPFKQPDGSIVTVKVYGDEYYRRMETLDGYTVVKNNDGWLAYAELNEAGDELVPSTMLYGVSASTNVVTVLEAMPPKNLSLPTAVISEKVKKAQQLQEAYEAEAPVTEQLVVGAQVGVAANGFVENLSKYYPVIGDYYALVILIDFSDQPATVPREKIERYMNESGYADDGNNGSVFDYYNDVSNQNLRLTHYVTDYYRASQPKSYYDDAARGGTVVRELLQEALDYFAAQGLDYSQFTPNPFGQVGGLSFFYAGYREPDNASGLWPHASTLYTQSGGVDFARYQITDITDFPSLRTYCHELGHSIMRWPDLYDSDYSSYGLGQYGLMAYGANDYNPVPPNPYLRALAGWQDFNEFPSVDTFQTVSVAANSFDAYSFVNPGNPDEFYIYEAINNGAGQHRHQFYPDQGLIIWHIDSARTGNNSEVREPSNHYQVSVEQADGLFELEEQLSAGGDGDLYHDGGATIFSGNTVPKSHWWSGLASYTSVTGVSAIAPTMTFNFAYVTDEYLLEYEAEDQTWSQAVFENSNTGFSGTGYVNTDNTTGGWIEFEVDVPASAEYFIDIGFANGASASRPADISVNGAFVLAQDFVYTGSWTVWEEQGLNLFLNSGVNTIRLTATGAAGLANIDYLKIHVDPTGNLAPILLQQKEDETVFSTGGSSESFANYFVDPNGDPLTFEVVSSAPSVVAANVFGSNFDLDYLSGGVADITISAYDGEFTVSDTFTITVIQNSAPYAAVPISNYQLAQGSAQINIDLNSVFVDPDGDPMSFTIYDSSGQYANVFITNSILTINPQLVGSATITVTARDPNNAIGSDIFTLTVVDEQNLPPVVTNPITDLSLLEGEVVEFDLNTVFSDPEGEPLSFQHSGNSDAQILSGYLLQITANTLSTSTHTLTAVDSEGEQVSFSFNVTVSPENTNNPPIIISQIENMVLNFGDASFLIDLNTVFSDPDGDSLTFNREASDDESLNVYFEGNSSIRISAVEVGTVSHYLSANDGNGGQVSFWFDLTVLAPPSVELELQAEDQTWADAAVEADHAGYTGAGYVNTVNAVDTWVNFSVDVPIEGSYSISIRYANGSSARNQAILVDGQTRIADVAFDATGAWATWADEVFTLDLDQGENSIRLVSLTSGGAPNLDSMLVRSLDQPNTPPTVQNPIADITLAEGDNITLDISGVFFDYDGDALTYSVSSNNAAVVTGNVNASILTVSGVSLGAAYIYVEANDGVDSVTDYVLVNVISQNRAPEIINPIDDFTIVQGSNPIVIELNTVFSDIDGDTLSFDRDSSYTDSPNVRFINNATAIEIDPIEVGTEWHDIIASDSEFEVVERFTLTVVAAGNQPPVISQQKDDVIMSGLGEDHVGNLANYFSDPDGDVLSYSVSSDNASAVTVSLDGTAIIVHASGYGSAVISVLASDGEASVIMTFNVDVPSPNNAPQVISPIDDITLVLGEASFSIDLNTVFSDPDGDALFFNRDSSNSDSPNVRFINGNTALEINADEVGTEWHDIIASDGDLEVVERFTVTVVNAPQPPVVVNPIADIEMSLGDAVILIDLNTVFFDPEGATLTFDHYPQDEELDDVQLLAGGILQIDADYVGTNTHTVFALDDQGLDTFVEFSVTVTSTNTYSAVLEAEDQTWLNATVDSNHAGFTGTGFVNTENVQGTWFEISLDVPASGVYQVSVVYANGSTSRNQQIEVNGNIEIATVEFANSGGWANWISEVFTVNLTAGANSIRMSSLTSGGAPNLDRIEIELLP